MSAAIKVKINKGSNRTSLDIVRDVLVAASASVGKTKIMYQANLNYVTVRKYLRELLLQGLLKRDRDSCYLITGKGMEFLKLYGNYVERCTWIEEQVNQSVKERLFLEKMCSGSEFNCERNARKKIQLINNR